MRLQRLTKGFHLSIRNRFFILIFIVLAGCILILLAFNEAIQRTGNARKLRDDMEKIHDNLVIIQYTLPELYTPESASKWISVLPEANQFDPAALVDQTTRMVASFHEYIGSNAGDEFIQNYRQFEELYADFRKQFIQLIEKYNTRGTSRSGLTGKIMQLVNESKSQDPLYTSLRQYLSVWLMTGQRQALDKMRRLFPVTEPGIRQGYSYSQNAGVEADVKRQICSVLDKLIELDETLNPPQQSSMLSATESMVKQLDNVMLRIVNKASANEARLSGSMKSTVFLVVFILSFLFFIPLFLLGKHLQISLTSLLSYLKELSLGRIPGRVVLPGNDEFHGIANGLNVVIADLRRKANYANDIGQGKHDSEYAPLSEEDLLGNALLYMNRNLREAHRAREKHEKEERKRRWTNEGLAKFAEILRLNSNDLQNLSDQIVRNLTKDLRASQGALFLLREEETGETVMDMVSLFAHDRKKYNQRSFLLGEGLVGTCAIEKESIYLTEIPSDYITVSSGLGESKPKCIVLVPLKLEDRVLGVIELASLAIVETHEVEFLERIAESCASAISLTQINIRNKNLLEQSQRQARELAEQDEQMRKNLLMLQTAQEEASRREMEIRGILSAINNSSLVMELDPDTRILSVNDRFCRLLGSPSRLIVGKLYGNLLNLDISTDSYQDLWRDLRRGTPHHAIETLRLSGDREAWLSLNFTPVQETDKSVTKILCIASDISESKQQEIKLQERSYELLRKNIELETLNKAVDNSLLRCVFSADAVIIDVNDNYLITTGFSKREVVGKPLKFFLKSDEMEQFRKVWAEIMKGKSYTGVMKRTKPTGEEVWLMSGFSPLKDEKSTIYKVYYLGQDITERRLKYKLLEEANREIERLRTTLGKLNK